MSVLRRSSFQNMAGYVLVIVVLWLGFDADTRGNCGGFDPCDSPLQNDFFVATVPVAILLVAIATRDAVRPDPRLGRLSAFVFALGVVLFALLSFGVIGDVLDDLRGAHELLIIK